jgi:hypothetical protein
VHRRNQDGADVSDQPSTPGSHSLTVLGLAKSAFYAFDGQMESTWRSSETGTNGEQDPTVDFPKVCTDTEVTLETHVIANLKSLLVKPLSTRSSTSNSSRILRKVLSLRPKQTDVASLSSSFNHHGSLGLQTVFTPSNPLIEYVFIHGLGGGSTRTWCLKPEPAYFWPKEWLPRHPGFRNVRIHSFGYDSDWKSKGQSTVTAHDFGQALLLALRNSECFSFVCRRLNCCGQRIKWC